MISKVTMYDALVIVGPGAVILFLLSSLCKWGEFLLRGGLVSERAIQLGLLVLLSYLIGLLWNKVSEYVFDALRNKEVDIEKCRHQVIEDIISREKGHSCPTTGHSCPCIAQGCLLFGQQCPLTSRCYPLVSRSYYSAYYNLMSKDKLGSVPVLEAQVAFFRNCILIVPIATAWLCNLLPNSNELTPCWSGIFLLGGLMMEIMLIRVLLGKDSSFMFLICLFALVLALSFLGDCICLKVLATLAVQGLLFVMMRRIQTKVYSLVWEGNAYIS